MRDDKFELTDWQNKISVKMSRASGVLLPISSLPSPYGIGSLGQKAYDFVDFLCESGQTYWQILPVGPTGFANSPYQPLSVYAGNPFLIDLDDLIERGLLEKEAVYQIEFGVNLVEVDYRAVYSHRDQILFWAYEAYLYRQDPELKNAIKVFRAENEDWLEEFALYMALKHEFAGSSWREWPRDLAMRQPDALKAYVEANKLQIDFQIFLQYLFYDQWSKLKAYANEKGIKIIGDLPLYVAEDSVDFWAHREIFQVDSEGNPTRLAGTPPDFYTQDGQLWGNPLFDWNKLAEEDYAWWCQRLAWSLQWFDFIRLDHFRGFDSYWTVDREAQTARDGSWQHGPQLDFFRSIYRSLGPLPIIAEDLGVLSEEVFELRAKLDFPGMSVLQFAFDPSMTSQHLPHNVPANSVYYVGTHDNDTVLGWCKRINNVDLELAKLYLGLNDQEGYNWGIMRGVMTSSARVAILQMQDLLGFDNWARFNRPGEVNGNWKWRMQEGEISDDLAYRLKFLTKLAGRLPEQNAFAGN